MPDRAYLERLSRDLIDKGKLIEAGWVGFRVAVYPLGAPKTQLQELRKAFFAGSQHLFASIMTILDEDEEPTPEDLRRMDLINTELQAFAHEIQREISGTPETRQ